MLSRRAEWHDRREELWERSPVFSVKSGRPWELVGVLSPPQEPRRPAVSVVVGPELARAMTMPPPRVMGMRGVKGAPVGPSAGATAAKEIGRVRTEGSGTPGADLARELLEGLRKLGAGQNQAQQPCLYAAARPDKFRGDKNSNIRAWLYAMEMFLEATGQAKTEWAKIVLLFFGDPPR